MTSSGKRYPRRPTPSARSAAYRTPCSGRAGDSSDRARPSRNAHPRTEYIASGTPTTSSQRKGSNVSYLFITQRNLPNSNRFLHCYGYIVPPYFARHSQVVVMVKLPLRGSPLKLMDASGTMTLPDVFTGVALIAESRQLSITSVGAPLDLPVMLRSLPMFQSRKRLLRTVLPLASPPMNMFLPLSQRM